jgi:hypothetical protein
MDLGLSKLFFRRLRHKSKPHTFSQAQRARIHVARNARVVSPIYKFTTLYAGTRCSARGQTGLVTFASRRARTHRIRSSSPRAPAAARPAGIAFIGARETPRDWSIYILPRAASQVHLWHYIQLPRLMRSEWVSVHSTENTRMSFMFLRSLLSRDIIATTHAIHVFLGTPNTHNGPDRGWELAVFSFNPLRQTVECVVKIVVFICKATKFCNLLLQVVFLRANAI